MTRPALPCALLLLAAAAGALAQPVYRGVDAGGRPVFSDQPPSPSAQPAQRGTGAPAAASSTLPFELRQVVQRYPVTLYSSEDCGPCSAGRSLLITRGVPFDERTVKSNDDVAAFQRLSGQASVPLLAIGSQQLKGFSDAEWSQYLDAAGYPKSNQLPAGFRNPPAQPMVAQQQAAPAPAAASPAPAAPPPAPATGPTPDNPAGIRF